MHARDLVEPVDAELKAKVRATLWEETPMGATWAWERLVSRPERDVGDLEYVSRLWGYVFGMAYGIARGENPYESNEDCSTRAYLAAYDLFANEGDDLIDGIERIRAAEAGLAFGIGPIGARV